MKRTTRLTAALAAVTLAGLLSAGLGAGNREPAASDVRALPAAPASALQIDRPLWLSSGRYLSRWTVVRAATAAHARPSANSRVVAELAAVAPEGTPNLLTVLRSRGGADGALWVEVRLPVLPNGSVGWVQRRSLGPYSSVDTHLVVDRGRLRATLYRAGRIVFSAPVGVGTGSWPTPAG